MNELTTAAASAELAPTKKELAALTVNRVRECESLDLATLLQIIRDCGEEEGFFALTINELFTPAEVPKLEVSELELPQLVRLLVLFAAVSLDKIPQLDTDGNVKTDAAGKPVTRKRALRPAEFLEALALSDAAYRERYARELAALRERWPTTLENTATHLLKAYDSSLGGRVRVNIPASSSPWLCGSALLQLPKWVFAGGAADMVLSLLVQANFVVEGARLSLIESLLQGDARIRDALIAAGAYLDEAQAGKHFATDAAVLPEAVPARAPQLLWDTPQGPIALTPVASAAGLTALRLLGRSPGVRSRTLHYGGAQPQNVSAYMFAVRGDVATPLSTIPNIDFSFNALTLDRIFSPRFLTRASARWCDRNHLAGFEERSNRWRQGQLQRLARLAVEKIAQPLFALREVLESGFELRQQQREALERSTDPALLYARGLAQPEARAALAERLVREIRKSLPVVAELPTEWERYLTRAINRELEFAQ